MIRLSSLIVFAGFLACAVSQSPTATASSVVVSSTAAPEPSPTGTPQPLPPDEYVYRDDKGVCLQMKADILVAFYYDDNDGKAVEYNYTLVNTSARVDDGLSVCGEPTKLVLAYTPPEKTDGSNYLTFTFVKPDKTAWTSQGIEFNFIFTEARFNDSEFYGKNLTYNSTANFLGENVDLAKSYLCKTNDDVTFDSSHSNYTLNVTLKVTNLQVQPYFEFKEGKEKFDAPTECAADSSSKGNKIVPIAVGAALAGLVIVVLIAYLIGRLKSRRQSSYEALS